MIYWIYYKKESKVSFFHCEIYFFEEYYIFLVKKALYRFNKYLQKKHKQLLVSYLCFFIK